MRSRFALQQLFSEIFSGRFPARPTTERSERRSCRWFGFVVSERITVRRKTQRMAGVNLSFDFFSSFENYGAMNAVTVPRRAFAVALLVAFLVGCVTPQPGHQSAVIRAEQVLSVSLAAIDSFLAFESRRRADLPADVRNIAARVRAKAPQAFESANRLRLVYKLNRMGANEASLLTALAVVESLVAEIRVWIPVATAGAIGSSPVDALVAEAQASRTAATGSWIALVPVFVDLAREIYATVNRVRDASKQAAEWTAEQEAEFSARLSAIHNSAQWL